MAQSTHVPEALCSWLSLHMQQGLSPCMAEYSLPPSCCVPSNTVILSVYDHFVLGLVSSIGAITPS